jgi:O-antigen ligase
LTSLNGVSSLYRSMRRLIRHRELSGAGAASGSAKPARRSGVSDLPASVVLGLLALFAATSVVLARGLTLASGYTPVLAGGLALAIVFALAFSFYEGATVFAFALLGVARVEPAPPDLIFATLMLVAAVTGRFKVDQLPSIVALLLSALLVLNVVSLVDVVDPGTAVRFLVITAYLTALAAWLTGYARSYRRVRGIVAAYVWAAVVMSAVSSAALFLPFPGHDTFLFEGGQRAEGLFKDPNVYGPFLVPAILVLIEELFQPRLLRAGRFVKAVSLAVLAMGLLVAFSRAAWFNGAIAVTILLAIHALRRGGARRALSILSLLAVMGTFLLLVVVVTDSTAFIESRAHFQYYDADRFGAQSTGFALVGQHPLGIGPGQFELFAGYAAHSLYIRLLTEQGVLGFLILVLLLVYTLFLAVRNVLYGRDTYGLGSAVLLAAWCGVLANGVFVDTLHWRHLWVLAALVWAGARIDSSTTGARSADLAN